MKTIKVSIQDENTLVLQEDAQKGDLIDLKSLHETDIDKSSIESIVNAIERGEFEKEINSRVVEAKRLAESETRNAISGDISKLRDEIADLKGKLNNSETAKELEVKKAIEAIQNEKLELANRLKNVPTEKELTVAKAVNTLKDTYDERISDLESDLKTANSAVELYKDMKAKLSVKLVGENLEQHCQNEFNSVRAGQFPFAYFEKDNQAIKDDGEIKGTKGDFIYKDFESQDGTEIISIMFEMKDEQDVSENKRTVESHLDKLDKDRKKKGLEYAVLVTLLELDNELYNRGILDVSYKFDKMFVIRPQFFLPLITLLKNASMKSANDRRQLVAARNSNIDIENFVENMETWKAGWTNSAKNAYKKHLEGIEQINKAIKDLEKTRDALMLSDKHLLAAGNKVDDLTIKRLTKNAPSVAERFEELNNL
jgi:hypothetical protein